MVGHGIASSLLHEVGHQAAALLDLVASLQAELDGRRKGSSEVSERLAWQCWRTWISEITADFWSIAKLGVGSTLGLLGVVSLPRRHVFRVTLRDPHPFPWIRVKVSAAIGSRLYPSRQWGELETMWERLYPRREAPATVRKVIDALEPTIPSLAELIVGHRPRAMRGVSLGAAVRSDLRTPGQLLETFRMWQGRPELARSVPPTLFLAVLGQARLAGRLTPEQETAEVSRLLAYWAMRSTLDVAAASAAVVRQSIPIERSVVRATA
jgi:hypothetical protein